MFGLSDVIPKSDMIIRHATTIGEIIIAQTLFTRYPCTIRSSESATPYSGLYLNLTHPFREHLFSA